LEIKTMVEAENAILEIMNIPQQDYGETEDW